MNLFVRYERSKISMISRDDSNAKAGKVKIAYLGTTFVMKVRADTIATGIAA